MGRGRTFILMSRDSLARLVPAKLRAATAYTGLQLGPCSSNLYLFVDRSAGA